VTPLATRIEAARAHRGISTRRLAADSGLSDRAIRLVRNGEAKAGPTLDTVERLAAALRVTPAWLAFGEGEGPSEAE
jgi:transcriptional regulator with XRE-family HTH domain